MSISALVISEKTLALQLIEVLNNGVGTKIDLQLVRPSKTSLNPQESKNGDQQNSNKVSSDRIEPLAIEQMELLNPKLARKRRQKTMAFWLMPFGLFAGLSFSQMTGLETFSNIGAWADPLISSLLGLFSGLMGSYVAAASVNSGQQDSIRKLIKYNQEGCWLIIVETPSGLELPWHLMQESKPLEVFQLSEM